MGSHHNTATIIFSPPLSKIFSKQKKNSFFFFSLPISLPSYTPSSPTPRLQNYQAIKQSTKHFQNIQKTFSNPPSYTASGSRTTLSMFAEMEAEVDAILAELRYAGLVVSLSPSLFFLFFFFFFLFFCKNEGTGHPPSSTFPSSTVGNSASSGYKGWIFVAPNNSKNHDKYFFFPLPPPSI